MKPWIQASRLRTLPLATACVMVGGGVSFRLASSHPLTEQRFGVVFAIILITVILLQILSNWANDWGDFENGADDATRTDRAVASGLIAPVVMKRAVKRLSAVAFASGITAITVALWGTELILSAMGVLVLCILSIAAAFRYTAGANPYGYKGYGDAMVLLFFGWIGVGGTGFLLAHDWNWAWMLPATWCGALSTAVLNLNNMRDHVNDERTGKRTLVVQMGWRRAKLYHTACFAIGWLSWWVFALVIEAGLWRGLGWMALINAVHAAHVLRVWKNEDPKSLDGELKKVAFSTAVAALFMLLAQTGAA